MIQSPINPRPSTTTETTTAAEPTDPIIRSHDMRSVGLKIAGQTLHANVGALDIVFVARARSDISYCPICPAPHPA